MDLSKLSALELDCLHLAVVLEINESGEDLRHTLNASPSELKDALTHLQILGSNMSLKETKEHIIRLEEMLTAVKAEKRKRHSISN